MASYCVKKLMRDLRSGKYTSIGSYPTFFMTSDGEALSHEAVLANLWQVARSTRDRLRDGWDIIGFDINWEDDELICSHTGKRIECAYPKE